MSNERSKANSESRRVVINDASCLIDLHKVGLVEAMLRLPYDFVVALPVAHNEVMDFTDADWARFSKAGLEKVDLDPNQVGRAIDHQSQNAKLSAEDCFSLVLAQDFEGSILLTGDAELRSVAVDNGCEVHGVLWVADEIQGRGLMADSELAKRLVAWLNDPLVRLPVGELDKRLRLLAENADAGRGQGSPPPTKLRDRYFRTENEVINDEQSIAVEPTTRNGNPRVSKEAFERPPTPQKARTSAPSSSERPKLIDSQIGPERPDPLPYFVREIGVPLEKPTPQIQKHRHRYKKKP